MSEEIDDQAAFVGDVVTMHLRQNPTHPLDLCPFCELLGLDSKTQTQNIGKTSYRFCILDFSNPNGKVEWKD